MATTTKLERDAVALDPQHYTVEVESDTFRVVRIRYGGRERSVMHQHERGVVVFLTDADFMFAYPDGSVDRVHATKGDFLTFEEPWEHNPENNSDNDFEAVYVEMK